jgi:hypothetical protein
MLKGNYNILEFAFENHGKIWENLKSIIFWDITPCSALKVNWPFGGTCRLDLLPRWFLPRFILLPWRWRRHVPLKRRVTCNGLHGVISQKIVLFITTTVRTSNPKRKILFWIDNNPTWHIPSVVTVWNGIVQICPHVSRSSFWNAFL